MLRFSLTSPLFVLFSLVLGACGPAPSERTCASDVDCPSPQTCEAQKCVAPAGDGDGDGDGDGAPPDGGQAGDGDGDGDGAPRDGGAPADAGGGEPDSGAPGSVDGGAPDGGVTVDAGPPELCGNGAIDDDEACDDGVANGDYGACAADCTGPGPRCGDGALDFAFGEVCDDGVNDGAHGGCAACVALGPRCGDNIVQTGAGEVCDDGSNTGAYEGCAAGCTALGPFCGDGVTDVSGLEVCDDGVNDELGGGCLPGCDEEDTSDAIFGLHILEVDIDIDVADWDALRHESKRRHTIFGTADCRNEQIENPYNWYAANVTVDGTPMLQTGVRKKGHLGSGSTTKPSIKLKFDHVFDSQSYETMDRLALNNSKSDASYFRMCLSYEAFRQAGYPAPRCTWSHVTVNGEDMGLYVAVEEVKKRYLRRHFESDEGNLYEGTACDWRPEFFGGFEQETNENSDPSRADLQAVLDVVEVPDAEIAAALEPLFDMERLYRFWALEGLVWHRDGYSGNANNYFLYADPSAGGRFVFLPWGTDAVMRANTAATYPDSVLARGRVVHRLYQNAPTQALYYDALDDLLENTWDPVALVGTIDAMEADLLNVVPAAQQAGFTSEVAFIRDFITNRKAVMEAAYAGGFPEWTAGMRTKPCNAEVGTVSATFATTWGTLTSNLFSSGTGTVQMTVDGEPITFGNVGVRAGYHANGSRRLQMDARFTGAGGENRRWFFTVVLPDNIFFEETLEEGTHLLHSPPWIFNATERDLDAAQNTRSSNVGEGVWVFDTIEPVDDGIVSGSFTGVVYDRILD